MSVQLHARVPCFKAPPPCDESNHVDVASLKAVISVNDEFGGHSINDHQLVIGQLEFANSPIREDQSSTVSKTCNQK